MTRSNLDRDEWPSGWVNVGEIVEGKLPKAAPETVTLSLKVPAAMKGEPSRLPFPAGDPVIIWVRALSASTLAARISTEMVALGDTPAL